MLLYQRLWKHIKLKKNMKLFDTAMSSVFSNFIAKINKNKNSGGEFAYLLGSIFGPILLPPFYREST